MRGLELRNRSVDLVVNDLSPGPGARPSNRSTDSPSRRRRAPTTRTSASICATRHSPIGACAGRSAYAVDTGGHHCVSAPRPRAAGHRHRAVDVVGVRGRRADASTHDLDAARRLLDEAGFRDPDGAGPEPRLRLTLKTSTDERYRLQAAVIQQNLARSRHRGRDSLVRIRHAHGRCHPRQRAALHPAVRGRDRSGHAAARRSTRRRCRRPDSIAVITTNRRWTRCSTAPAARWTKASGARSTRSVQQLVADDAPYISLWAKTNVAVSQRDARRRSSCRRQRISRSSAACVGCGRRSRGLQARIAPAV